MSCLAITSVIGVTPVAAVSLDAPTKRCLEQSIGKSATRAIERAKKLNSKQARSVAACKSQAAPATTTTTTTPVGSALVYDLDPALSDADVARVKQWTSEAVARQQDLFGITITEFTTNVSRDPTWLANRDCRRHSGWTNCVADRTNLFRSTWAFAGCTPAPRVVECYQVANLANFQGEEYLFFKTFVHEVHHVVQDQLHRDYEATRAPSNSVRRIGPDWLLEGAAEFIGYQIASDAGKTTMAASRADWIRVASGISGPLNGFEAVDGRSSVGNAYHLFALAIDELLKLNGNTPRSISRYYQLLSTGVGWPAAFLQAFGMSHDAFYSHFETPRPR